MLRALPLAVLVLASGCSLVGPDASAIAFDGSVTYVTIEGGAWVLAGDDGVTYQPLNLPESFVEEGLRVRVEAEARDDLASFLMVGPIVEIERIERL